MASYDMVWYGMVWYGMIWYGMLYLVATDYEIHVFGWLYT